MPHARQQLDAGPGHDAVGGSGHHPRLAHLHEALASLRSVLPPSAWAADWRDAHDRLDDLRQRLGDGLWAQGLARVTDADRELISHLLTGTLT